MKPPPHQSSAFSLIELLVVMAIIGMLAVFTIPALRSIGEARGATEAAFQISAAVELARAEAIARQTFVWIGLQPRTDSDDSNLWIGTVFSSDGTPTSDPSNLQPLGRALVIRRAALVDAQGVSNVPQGSAISEMFGYSGGARFSVGSVTFNGCTLTFSPLGEVMRTASPSLGAGFEPRIGIGIISMRGTNPIAESRTAVLIDGSTGSPSIFRE